MFGRDGLGPELWDITEGVRQQVLEAFYFDAADRMTFSAYRQDRPSTSSSGSAARSARSFRALRGRMSDPCRLLAPALGFARLDSYAPELCALHRWLNTWRGIGDIVGKGRQDADGARR